jgi:hypothetical protein
MNGPDKDAPEIANAGTLASWMQGDSMKIYDGKRKLRKPAEMLIVSCLSRRKATFPPA